MAVSTCSPLPWLCCWVQQGLSPFLHFLSCYCNLLLCALVSLTRKKKPLCTVLPGTAITLRPEPCAKPAATWTLRTEKERRPSWQPRPEATTTSSSVWLNTQPTLTPLTRCFGGEGVRLTEKWSGGWRHRRASSVRLSKMNLNAANCNCPFSSLFQRFCELP